jgi:hypothetical protein
LNYQLNVDQTFGMPNAKNPAPETEHIKPEVKVHLCIPEDQERFLPKRRKAPPYLPPEAPLPRHGEVIYLSSSSAWGVAMVIHDWLAPDQLRIEIWLEYVNASRHLRPPGFALTQ